MSFRYGVGSSAEVNLYRGYSTGAGNTAGLFCVLTRWNCEPGTKTITEAGLRFAFKANVTGLWLVVYSLSGSTLTRVGMEALTGWIADDSTDSFTDSTVSLSVDIEAGTDYFVGVAMDRPAADGSGQPGLRSVSGLTTGNDNYWFSLNGESSPPASFE